jgi:hypothetical protein
MNWVGGSLSVHERESLLVLLRLLSCEFLLQTDLSLLLVVVLKGGFDPDPAGHHGSYFASEVINLEIMDSPVELIDFLRVEVADHFSEFLAYDVFEDVGLDFGAGFHLVVLDLENLEDELESLLGDIVDGDLG